MSQADPDHGGAAVLVDGDGGPEAPVADQRTRILETALQLMADGGLHGTSMRSLASACGLNVATIYHYFPSKQAILAAALTLHSIDLLGEDAPVVDRSLDVPDRVAALVEWILRRIPERGDATWRLLLGESLRGEPTVVESAAALSDAFEQVLVVWLGDIFSPDELDVGSTARLVRAAVYGCVVESLLARDRWEELAVARATDVAATLRSVSG
ncbi:MAG: TetR/AcrR family transcriptional regulator [Acidimicrobiia bacterium]|nr:TetR/AcrR family transcriptional regulator [Acidimicrobiia bacterium]